MEQFLNAFIPLFFAFDAIGILPVFMSITQDLFIDKKRLILHQAVLTAFFLSLVFIYLGKGIFHFLGITVADFRIAGGILLLVIATYDLIVTRQARAKNNTAVTEGVEEETHVGIVPIGMPLIVGPAVLTTLLLSTGQNGYTATTAALLANIFIVWVVFYYSDKIIKVIRKAGAIAVGKVFSLLLAAIAVKMIRIGILEYIK
ncbi:MAG: MarC family protein [Oligoflexia bacterium]|nr:MarC family protein [Oligoflexia bacterium]